MRGVAPIFIYVLATSVALAEGLRPGDILISGYWPEGSIESNNYLLTIRGTGDVDFELTVSSRSPPLTRSYGFESGMPTGLEFVGLNERYYCDEATLFVSLRYDIPARADIRQYLFDTYAFRRDDLVYLGTVDVDFADIGPHAIGTDLGFRYEMPQPYVVTCNPKFAFRKQGQD